MKLRAVPKAGPSYTAGPEAIISMSADGELEVDCRDDQTFDFVAGLLAERLFVQGQGFPKFQRDELDRLVRDPQTQRYVLTGYVDLNAPHQDVLDAIRDNLEATEQFELDWVGD